jgi:hypothetical protein
LRLSKNQQSVLDYIKENEYCNAQDISEQLPLKLYYTQLALDKLSDNNLIEWIKNPEQPLHGTHQSPTPVYGWKVSLSFFEGWNKVISGLKL